MRLSPLRLRVSGIVTAFLTIFLVQQYCGRQLIPVLKSTIFNVDVVTPTWLDARREFWSKWALVFEFGQPQINPISVQTSAPIDTPKTPGPRKEPHDYLHLSEDSISSLRTSHEVVRRALDAYDDSKDQSLFQGKGVVLVAGGQYFAPAIVSIHALRQKGSNLPVEAFLANQDEWEPYLCEEYLPSLNARCLVMTDFTDDKVHNTTFEVKHFQFKALALLFSSFKEVLLIDSDSIPICNPEIDLFSSTAYRSTGFIGWGDFWIGTESPAFYDIAGLPSFPENLPQASSESGQLILDKSRHLKTLLLAVYYNVFGPGYYYQLLSQGAMGEGDKNTFETAAVVLGTPYFRVPDTPPAVVGRFDKGEFRGSAMIQMKPGQPGKPAFIHANTPKMNAGQVLDSGDLFEKNTKERLRLWGPKDGNEKFFGEDVEMRIWKIMVDTGCQLEDVLRDWKTRDHLCARLREHYESVFGGLEEIK